jgi:hypothetical protein
MPGAGRLRIVGTLDADRRGVTRLEMIVTDVETIPIGHVTGMDRQVEYRRMNPCHTHNASTMSASPSRTSTW